MNTINKKHKLRGNMRKKWILGVVAFGITLVYFLASIVISLVNYKKNTEVWEALGYTGLIYNQHAYEDISFGAGTMAKNGCAASCVYNILRLDGKYVPLPDIIKKFDVGGENLMGILGTHPYAIKSILSQYGYKAKFHLKSEKFEDLAKQSRYAILLYIRKTGGHFQLMTDYNKFTNEFQLYNMTRRCSMQQLLDEKGDGFKMLITVNLK